METTAPGLVVHHLVSEERVTSAMHAMLVSGRLDEYIWKMQAEYLGNPNLRQTIDLLHAKDRNAMFMTYAIYRLMAEAAKQSRFSLPSADQENLLRYLFDLELMFPFSSYRNESEARRARRYNFQRLFVSKAAMATIIPADYAYSIDQAREFQVPLSGSMRLLLAGPTSALADRPVSWKTEPVLQYYEVPRETSQIFSLEAYPWPVILYKNRVGFIAPNSQEDRVSVIQLSRRFPDGLSLDAECFHRATLYVDERNDLHVCGLFSAIKGAIPTAKDTYVVGDLRVKTETMLSICRAKFRNGLEDMIPTGIADDKLPTPDFVRYTHVENLLGEKKLLATQVGNKLVVIAKGGIIADGFSYIKGVTMHTEKRGFAALRIAERAEPRHRTLLEIFKWALSSAGCTDAELIHSLVDAPVRGFMIRLQTELTEALFEEHYERLSKEALTLLQAQFNTRATAFFITAYLATPDDGKEEMAGMFDTTFLPIKILISPKRTDYKVNPQCRRMTPRLSSFTLMADHPAPDQSTTFYHYQWHSYAGSSAKVTHMLLPTEDVEGAQISIGSYSLTAGVLCVEYYVEVKPPAQEGAYITKQVAIIGIDDRTFRFSKHPLVSTVAVHTEYVEREDDANSGCFHRYWYVSNGKTNSGVAAATKQPEFLIAHFGNADASSAEKSWDIITIRGLPPTPKEEADAIREREEEEEEEAGEDEEKNDSMDFSD